MTAISLRDQANPEIEHFVRLANAGKSRLCGSGAIAARRIALCVLQHSPALDGQAIDGLRQFIELAKYMPETAQGVIER